MSIVGAGPFVVEAYRVPGYDQWRMYIKQYNFGTREGTFLLADGSWRTFNEGERLPEDVGIILPGQAYSAMADWFKGEMKPGASEATIKSLQESLTVERARVDAVLKELLPR